MLKDIDYALELAENHGLKISAANLTKKLLQETVEAGYADEYFPALIKVLDFRTRVPNGIAKRALCPRLIVLLVILIHCNSVITFRY